MSNMVREVLGMAAAALDPKGYYTEEDRAQMVQYIRFYLQGSLHPGMMLPRSDLQAFACATEKTLRLNDAEKGESWRGVSLEALETKLDEEMREVREARNLGMTTLYQHELTDLAAVAMMLWVRATEVQRSLPGQLCPGCGHRLQTHVGCKARCSYCGYFDDCSNLTQSMDD